ncbi:hypothetical protein [Marinobacterium rhizophilum]|uniref:hypothetical protein n=1 Tax=Marinobacterium rhizophilum TaxID=420402 RepID=UPI00037D90AF|nr:hypothetical protein [Marinobacterium rhizophilum]
MLSKKRKARRIHAKFGQQLKKGRQGQLRDRNTEQKALGEQLTVAHLARALAHGIQATPT